jgi:hypothetical protein
MAGDFDIASQIQVLWQENSRLESQLLESREEVSEWTDFGSIARMILFNCSEPLTGPTAETKNRSKAITVSR